MEAATATARPAAPTAGIASRSWRWLREHALHIYAGIAVAYVLVPIAVIAVFSFADAPPRDRLLFAINE